MKKRINLTRKNVKNTYVKFTIKCCEIIKINHIKFDKCKFYNKNYAKNY